MAQKVCQINLQSPQPFVPDPVPVSKGNNDEVRWQCRDPFSVTSITPLNPFLRALPFNSVPLGGINIADSGPLVEKAAEQEYKCKFTIGGLPVDPHIDVGP